MKDMLQKINIYQAEEESLPQENTQQVQNNKKLPDEYIQFDVNLMIRSLCFQMINEYDQKLIVFQLVRFEITYQQQNKIMRAKIQLLDFEIEDVWCKSRKFPRLIEAKEIDIDSSSIVFTGDKYQLSSNRTQKKE